MIQVKLKIKKGDRVIVIAGKSKGVIGKVLQVKKVLHGTSRVLVEGANMIKKHVKPNPQKGEPGGIKEKEAYLNISNVQIVDPVSNKGARIGYRVLENGRKVRYFKSTNEIVDVDQG